MPRRIEHWSQPQIAPSAGDLGAEAYEANKRDTDGVPPAGAHGDPSRREPTWGRPEPLSAPPGQHHPDGPTIRMGQDVPVQKGHTGKDTPGA